MNCRITKKPMTEILSLGDLYISDFIKTEGDYKGVKKWDLTLMLSSETQCLQLKESADKHLMYGKYWYHSGTNASMTNELKDIAESAVKLSKVKTVEQKVFLDIASNDGTLLSFVSPESYYRVAIDPAEGVFQEKARKNSESANQYFFSKEVYENIAMWPDISNRTTPLPKASIVTCIAMFYDLDDPIEFLKDVYDIMEDDGLFVIQQSYMPLMIKQLAFDNICHEHVFYHSLYSMEYMLDKTKFKVVDVQLNDINGGSFRTYIQKKKANVHSFGSSPYRDVANMRIQALREYEKTLKLDKQDAYMDFSSKIQLLKMKTAEFIKDAHNQGKSIWVYGASTKGNTLLQWFGLDNKLIDGAAERSPYKFGLKTIGTNIPIHSEETMRMVKPDYLLVLPWHFINEFVEREKEYLENGGHFIIPCPKFEII
jgi:SAM-dependent methyltransferase